MWVCGLQTCVYAHACMPMHAHGSWRSLTDGFLYIPLHVPLREGLLLNLEPVVISKLPGWACLYQHQPGTGIAAVWGPAQLLMWVWGLELKPSHLLSKTSYPLSPNCDFFHLLVGAACGGQRTTCSQFSLLPRRLQRPNSNHQS